MPPPVRVTFQTQPIAPSARVASNAAANRTARTRRRIGISKPTPASNSSRPLRQVEYLARETGRGPRAFAPLAHSKRETKEVVAAIGCRMIADRRRDRRYNHERGNSLKSPLSPPPPSPLSGKRPSNRCPLSSTLRQRYIFPRHLCRPRSLGL